MSQVASVVELVDAVDSKSSAFGRAGSSPARGTIHFKNTLGCFFIAFYINLTILG